MDSNRDDFWIDVHATPNAKKSSVGGEHAGRLRVSVTETADKGKANRAISILLAEAFGVAKSDVVLEKGPTSRLKRFRLMNPPSSAVSRLAELLGASNRNQS